MLDRILIGFIIAGVGFLFVWKSEWLLQNVGRVEWAEYKLSGGTRFFYKLVGIAGILIGFSVVTNLYSKIMRSLVELIIP